MSLLLKYIPFLLLFCFTADYIAAQDELTYPRDEYFNMPIPERSFDQEQWKKTIEGIDYSGGLEKDRSKDKNENNQTQGTDRGRFEEYDPPQVSSTWGPIMQFFFIGILVLMLAFVIANILKGGGLFKRKGKKVNPSTAFDLEKIEENIHESDLARLIRQAETDGQYNLAIRLYYLAIIKELSIQKFIKWKRDKTNRDYLREIGTLPFADAFRKATLIFERVWYGDSSLELVDYNLIKPQFEEWVIKVGNVSNKTN